MIRPILFLLEATVATTMVAAQTRPVPGAGDPRLRTVEYQADQIVQLEVAAGYQLSVEFAPDEQIESVAVGDSTAWLVTTNQRGSHLFVKPARADANTNMTVITDTRIYMFDLQALATPSYDMAYNVRFTFAAQGPPLVSDAADKVLEGTYRMSGDRRLRPAAIGDDGRQTFIEFPENAALPAIYAVDERGEERLVNGAMREGIFVIDAVSPRLVFRIDNRAARARRLPPEASR